MLLSLLLFFFHSPKGGDGGGLIFLETVNCQLKKLKKLKKKVIPRN